MIMDQKITKGEVAQNCQIVNIVNKIILSSE